MTEKQKNEGMLSFLASILGNDGANELRALANSVKELSDEMIILAKNVNKISALIEAHNAAINDLYTVQSLVIQQLIQGSDVDASAVTDFDQKNKSEKPN